RYVCPECGTPVKDLEAVRRRKEGGKTFINCQECDDVKVPFIDFIEQRLKSDPIARKILAMDEEASRGLDTQVLEQILIGHMMAIAGEANQIFRPVTMFDHGIDGEVEFKDNDGTRWYLSLTVSSAARVRDLVRVTPPGERIALAIDGADTHNSGQDGRVIVASLSGERRELNDAALLAAFAAFPLLTLKVVAGIHWEALKLWIKGMRLRPRPPAPQAITIVSRPLLRSSEVHGGHHV
ncbi:MAG: DUF1365 family protein, partial [Alphaproteobacteria bacterium]